MSDNIKFNVNCVEDEYDFYSFVLELQDLSESLNDFWLKNQSLIEKCEQMKTKIDKFKRALNITNSVGTGVSAVGSIGILASFGIVAGVVLTPFTAGISGILLNGGIVATTVGTITSIGGKVTDNLKMKSFCKEIQQLAQMRDKCLEKLNKKFIHKRFDQILMRFLNEEEFNRNLNDNLFEDNNNFVDYITLLAKGSKNVYDLGDSSLKMYDSIKEFNTLNAAIKSVSKVSTINAKLVQMSKSLFNWAPTETKVLNFGLVKTTGVSAGKLAFRGVSAGLGVVFTVVDVVNLVKDWNKTNPTIDVINHLIEGLEKDLVIIRKIDAFITSTYTSDFIDQQLIPQRVNSVDNRSGFNPNTTLPKELQMDSNENTYYYKKRN